jgi:glycosyltransferase involved in cell wall biosynthesis
METYCVELVAALKEKTNLTLEALPGRGDGATPSLLAIVAFGARTAFKILFGRSAYDVVHGADMAVWPLVLIALARSPRAKLVLSAHGTDVAFAGRKGFIPTLYRIYLRLGARLLGKATIIANSRATAAQLFTHGFQGAKVIPLASAATAERAPEDAPGRFVLFVGRLIRRKGCGWFIREVLPRLAGDIRLKVAGTIIDKEEHATLAHGRVDYLGPVFGEKLAALRQRSIAVMAPNIALESAAGFEGFGLTAVEGAAAGGVVLAAEIDGVADAVIDGKTGFLLPPGDAVAWAQKIAEIDAWDSARRRDFIDDALAAVRSHYSWDRVGADTLGVYGARMAAAPAPREASPPKVSIVMTAYNAEKYVRAALDSILAQTFRDFEFIIVDDGSTDATPDILATYARSDPRVRILRNEKNLSVPASANRGFAAARGDYIARMDADDVSFPERLEKQVAFLDAHPDFIMVGSGFQEIDGDGDASRSDCEINTAYECAWTALFRMPVIHSSLMFRREDILKHGIEFDAAYDGAADFEFVQKLLRHGKGCALPHIHIQYRMHPDNVSTRKAEKQRRAARAASIKEAAHRFPDISERLFEDLFDFLHASSVLSAPETSAAISALDALTERFCESQKLGLREQRRVRALAARWLVAAAMRQKLYLHPALFAAFLWAARDYLPSMPREAGGYVRRRFPQRGVTESGVRL